jgi:predicted dinucleotide-binding enzyme
MENKTVGILGSGNVGQVLANGFLTLGYKVKIGTRDISKLTAWKENAGANASLGSVAETASYGEILVLAVKGKSALEVLKNIGENSLNGKIIIDTTNPIDDLPPQNGVLRFFTDLNESLMEKLQKTFPSANFVKAFNSVGSPFMVNPVFAGGKPTMFVCGNNDVAKLKVTEILDKFGWEISDMGKVEAARAIEPLCMLWCIPGMLNNEWHHAFKLLK